MDTKSKYKILVIGDVVLDKYIFCSPERINREAPTLIFSSNSEEIRLGGAGNVVSNLLGLKRELILMWPSSEDQNNKIIEKKLLQAKVFSLPIKLKDKTTVKTRIFSDNKQLFRFDETHLCKKNWDSKLVDKLDIRDVKVCILSDYGSGFLKNSKELIKKLNNMGILVIVDPRSKNCDDYSGAYLLTPNFSEFQSFFHHQIDNNPEDIEKNAKELTTKFKIKNILVTRGEKGMMLINERGCILNINSSSLEVVDVSGAGDTVVATIASEIANGNDLKYAIEISSYAASIVIRKAGVVPITNEDLILNKENVESKISYLASKDTTDYLRKINSKDIVFTNGAFDILHFGHISYLLESSKLNKYLVVGLNSDASIKKYKSLDRPINTEMERALTIAALPFVHRVIIFSEKNAKKIIKRINPEIYTKGSDYKDKDFVEKHLVKNMIYIDFKKNYSTTNIIKKIREVSK